MSFKPTSFAEDTDFERLVLGLLGTHRVPPAAPNAVYDIRGTRREIRIRLDEAMGGAHPREELRQSLRPLGFGAAYKTLDMLIEHVLRANGAPAGRLTFATKTGRLASRPAGIPVPLDARPELWDRIALVYERLQDARHAVTHRRAQAAANGDLEIYDDQRREIDIVTRDEITSFAAAVHAISELVINASDDSRLANTVAWHLNALHSRHGLTQLQATDPNAGRRVLQAELASLSGGRLRFDVAQARETIEHQPAPMFWDLELYAGGHKFVGRWDEVPVNNEATYEFEPASPPPWLTEELAM